MTIADNVFYGNNTHTGECTIHLQRQGVGADDARMATIANNRFWYCRGSGIFVGGFQNVAITGNTFRVNPAFDIGLFEPTVHPEKSYVGIRIGMGTGPGDAIGNVSISGNTFDGAGKGIFLHGYSDFEATVDNVSIVGNAITNTGAQREFGGAIVLGHGSARFRNVNVSGNSFQNPGPWFPHSVGIYSSHVANLQITGNVFRNYSSALQIYDWACGVLVSGNLIQSCNRGVDGTLAAWPMDAVLLATGHSGSFDVDAVLTGSTSGATAKVTRVDDNGFGRWLYLKELTGLFADGETVRAASGGTGVVEACYASMKFIIQGNTFIDMADVGIRNFADSPIVQNVFVDVAHPAANGTYSGYRDNRLL